LMPVWRPVADYQLGQLGPQSWGFPRFAGSVAPKGWCPQSLEVPKGRGPPWVGGPMGWVHPRIGGPHGLEAAKGFRARLRD
jgi:hypothetical protein